MSFDFLTARIEKLKQNNQALAALDIMRQIRYETLSESLNSNLLSDKGLQLALQLYEEGRRPFENEDFLAEITWEEAGSILVKFLKMLAAAGLKNGGLHSLIRDLQTEPGLTRHIATAALEPDLQHLSHIAAKYGIETELLRFFVTTPLWPVFKKIRGQLKYNENPISVRRCLLCGSSYNLGVYRASLRNFLCTVCGHRIHVDFFYCPNCGNEEPQSMGFMKPEDEPALQIEYCRKCSKYYKFVDEDSASIFVEDPTVLELSTVDLDPVAREAAAKES